MDRIFPSEAILKELLQIARELVVHPKHVLLLYHDSDIRSEGEDAFVEQEVDDEGTKLHLSADTAAGHKRRQNKKLARQGRIVLASGAHIDWAWSGSLCYLDPSYIEMTQIPGNKVTLFPLKHGWNAVPVHGEHIQFSTNQQLVNKLNEEE